MLSSQLIIREAGPADAALIADLSRKTFFDTFAASNTAADMEKFMELQFSKEMLMEEVGQSGYRFFLAFSDKEPAGYIFLKDRRHPLLPSADAIEVSRLYADKNFIGRGVGKALLQFAIDTAIAENKKHIWLGVWEHNQRAIRFYSSFGFVKFSEHDFLLGDDLQRDWLMQKSL